MATWTDTVLCTVADCQARIRDIAVPFGDGKAKLTSDVIQQKITLTKDWIRQALLLQAPRLYAATTSDWIAYAQYQFDQRQAQSMASYRNAGHDYLVDGPDSLAWQGGFQLTVGSQLVPSTYYNYGTPTNGTSGSFAGAAEHGSFLVDTRYSQLYVNRGTLASPAWAVFLPEDCIDYITNPQELKHAAVSAVVWAIMDDGVVRFTATWERNFELYSGLVEHWQRRYKEELRDALQLLKIDITGDNAISQWERSATRSTAWIV